MWGFHDRLLTLRRALHDFLSCSNYKDALWRRWRWQLTQLNAEAGLVYTEEEWRKEWDSIVSMASSTPRNSTRRRSAVVDKTGNREVSENATYESLEEIHVLALSHVLRRPIIVIADTVLKDVNGEALAPILFGGIYLPLEILPSECHKCPLVLTFDAAHFSALVVMEKETFADKSPHPPAVIPLTDSHHKLLPVQFSVDPGEDFVWGRDENLMQITEKLSLGTKEIHALLREYLDVVYIPLSQSPSSDDVDFELELDTPCDEEDIEKRFIEANGLDLEDNIPEISESSLFGSNKSRAAKQMKSVAKQFGSIGKTMSKKLKKNFGTITKITRNNSQKKDQSAPSRLTNDDFPKTQDYMLCARLYTDSRHDYQEEMIKNYLTTARDRFEREKRLKQKFPDEELTFDDERLQEQAKIEGPKNCITQGCNMYGTVLTSYLCTTCYNKQRQEELSTNINSPSLPRAVMIPKKSGSSNYNKSTPGYGTGRSTFYFEASPKSYESAKNLTMSSGKSLKPQDDTLYLSNSTFYNDRPAHTQYYPKDWKSSSAGSDKNAIQYSLINDCQDRTKTWQEEIANQIDGLGSLTLPTGLSNTSNCRVSNDDLSKRNDGHKLADVDIKTSAKFENTSRPKLREQYDNGSGDLAAGPNITSGHDKSSMQRNMNSFNPEDVIRLNTWLSNTKTADSNFITTVPVRQSSQNNLEELVKVTTDYYNKNNETKSDYSGKLPVMPVEYSKAEGVNKINEVDMSGKKEEYVDRKLCLNVTCKFFGSPELDNYCSQCHRGRYENFRVDSSSKK
ncbi:UNVERIFIED_CONTAM: hypothetical protein PYX00_008665 [Menopon gallinae]